MAGAVSCSITLCAPVWILRLRMKSKIAGEPRGDLRVRYSPELLQRPLPPICGEQVANLIDEIPVLAVLGSQAAGGLKISDAQELRVKESDRISAIVTNLRAMGIEVEETADGLSMPGGQQLQGADIVTRNDHRIAMAFAVAALAAEGETRIHDAGVRRCQLPRLLDRAAKGLLPSNSGWKLGTSPTKSGEAA